MKYVCPNCKKKVSFKKIFFRNVNECKKCTKKFTISKVSRLKWIAPLMISVGLMELEYFPRNISAFVAISAIWFVVYPFYVGWDLVIKE